MPSILLSGLLRSISSAAQNALTDPAQGQTVPISGTDLQLTGQESIVIPNTTENTPDFPFEQQYDSTAEFPAQVTDPFEESRIEAEQALNRAELERIDSPSAVENDPFVLANADDEESIRVLPEDQFLQEGEDGLYVLREEAENQPENTLAEPVDEDQIGYYPKGTPYDDEGNLNPGWAVNPETGEPYYVGDDYIDPSLLDQAQSDYAAWNVRRQTEIQRQRQQAASADWRVKLSLSPRSNYLYNDPTLQSDGILYPLSMTNGVIFPYMPTINTSYTAAYNTYDLTHSNYRGYFYQGSRVNEFSINAAFTAQDTAEANYLLAVIHFFRSVTKMFYGQDETNRGAPPPLVFLTGLGEYQFNKHPCVVTNFEYNLPNDVDYIRARVASINGTNLLNKRDRQIMPTNPISQALMRLSQIGVKKGGINIPPPPPTLGLTSPTYVPTRIDITLQLLPVQTREQVSKQFSVEKFANGNLLKGGFW